MLPCAPITIKPLDTRRCETTRVERGDHEDVMHPRHPTGRIGVRLLAVATGLIAFALIACAGSPPVQAMRAARYYAEGTRALDRGEGSEAVVALERAVGLMPNASEIHNHLGLAYWSEGRAEDALRSLSRAVDLDCENEAARGNLARLRVELHGVEGDGVERSAAHGE